MRDEQGYTTAQRWFVASSAMLGFGLDFYNLIVIAFLLQVIQSSLHMGLPEAGTIIASTLAASVIGGGPAK